MHTRARTIPQAYFVLVRQYGTVRESANIGDM